MCFFNDKVVIIWNKIHHLLDANVSSSREISGAAENPVIYIDSFSHISLDLLTLNISSSKPATYLVDPSATKPLKGILPFINSTEYSKSS